MFLMPNVSATLAYMMKKQAISKDKALQPARFKAINSAGAAALIGAVLLAGCAGMGTHKPDQSSGNGVQVYGEIDVGYGHSRTKTRVQGQ